MAVYQAIVKEQNGGSSGRPLFGWFPSGSDFAYYVPHCLVKRLVLCNGVTITIIHRTKYSAYDSSMYGRVSSFRPSSRAEHGVTFAVFWRRWTTCSAQYTRVGGRKKRTPSSLLQNLKINDGCNELPAKKVYLRVTAACRYHKDENGS